MHIQKISQDTKDVMSLARKKHWGFRVLGDRGMIPNPIFLFGWWFIPLEQDKLVIPARANRRVQELLNAGVRIKGVIVAHQSTYCLPAPKAEPKPKPQPKPKKELDWQPLIKTITVALQITLGMATAVLYAVGIVLSVGVQMILIDPALIVVLEDGTWVEVMSWNEL